MLFRSHQLGSFDRGVLAFDGKPAGQWDVDDLAERAGGGPRRSGGARHRGGARIGTETFANSFAEAYRPFGFFTRAFMQIESNVGSSLGRTFEGNFGRSFITCSRRTATFGLRNGSTSVARS